MINYTKQKECIDEIRSVSSNPIKSIRLIYELKNKEVPTYKFVGYLNYYLKIGGHDLTPISTIDFHKSRESRLSLMLMQLDEIWKLGFVDDTQYAICKCGIRAINSLIQKYILIYLFL